MDLSLGDCVTLEAADQLLVLAAVAEFPGPWGVMFLVRAEWKSERPPSSVDIPFLKIHRPLHGNVVLGAWVPTRAPQSVSSLGRGVVRAEVTQWAFRTMFARRWESAPLWLGSQRFAGRDRGGPAVLASRHQRRVSQRLEQRARELRVPGAVGIGRPTDEAYLRALEAVSGEMMGRGWKWTAVESDARWRAVVRLEVQPGQRAPSVQLDPAWVLGDCDFWIRAREVLASMGSETPPPGALEIDRFEITLHAGVVTGDIGELSSMHVHEDHGIQEWRARWLLPTYDPVLHEVPIFGSS